MWRLLPLPLIVVNVINVARDSVQGTGGRNSQPDDDDTGQPAQVKLLVNAGRYAEVCHRVSGDLCAELARRR